MKHIGFAQVSPIKENPKTATQRKLFLEIKLGGTA
jgi:hypothetical protein